MKSRLFLPACLLLAACRAQPASSSAPDLKTDEDKLFYAVGYDMGTSVDVLGLQPAEFERVLQGVRDAVGKRRSLVEVESFRPRVVDLAKQRKQARVEIEKQKGKEALEQAAREPGAQQLPTGGVFQSLRAGTGATPTLEDTVQVNYEARLLDGAVVDDSGKAGPKQADLRIGLRCWREALPKMKVGEKAKVLCPPDAAYGNQGRAPLIPAAATIVFELELVGIAPPAESTPKAE